MVLSIVNMKGVNTKFKHQNKATQYFIIIDKICNVDFCICRLFNPYQRGALVKRSGTGRQLVCEAKHAYPAEKAII